MATPLPAPFKNADISRYALRAAQLEKHKPVIAYWCEYLIVNQILNKGLHTESDECMTFTTNLMDKLERFKSDNPTNDAVHDDLAAQAYVEQFAQETLKRAENAVSANKATAQTADTFRAAATFLDLLSVWQTPLSQEVAAKSKFAKFHALRMAKALKAGEDPNLSNPIQEHPASPPALALAPDDPDVQLLNSLQPTVEDDSETSRPPSFVDTRPSIPPASRSSTVQPSPRALAQGDVSPLDPPPNNDYFPSVPTFTADDTAPSLPTAPLDSDVVMGATSPQDFYNTQPTAPQAHPPPRAPSHPHMPNIQPAPSPQFPAPVLPTAQPFLQSRQPQPVAQPEPERLPGNYLRDDEAVLSAQKHAKWAISALNFEDVDTAVSELRIALRALGAS
ncbi:DUF605-domain-containing protein [Tothia fuscella]|uniref:DUF605-domain-containing protein n=1 Tax=Tothia fuscella TaxID=1048955 RepID=A0A9P4U3B2_9PEZI|nr:DUF605-domain-containing protein [Tothia fuscella]